MRQLIKTRIIDFFKNLESRINKNEYITNIDIASSLTDCYYNVRLIYFYNLLNKLSKEEIQLIINVLLFLTNKNTKNAKNIVNEFRNELKNSPNDNYDNMSKEELIALLRNK